MMLPVLSSEYFVYHHMQNTAFVRVYGRRHKYDNSDFAHDRPTHDRTVDILGQQQVFACYGLQSTRTTAQVAPFESPPCKRIYDNLT